MSGTSEVSGSPVPCPLQQKAFYFTYNNESGGFCRSPTSYTRPCAASSRLLFTFKHCRQCRNTFDRGINNLFANGVMPITLNFCLSISCWKIFLLPYKFRLKMQNSGLTNLTSVKIRRKIRILNNQKFVCGKYREIVTSCPPTFFNAVRRCSLDARYRGKVYRSPKNNVI